MGALTEVVEIAWGSAGYREALELRDAVLRVPLGLRLSEDELVGEDGDIHLGIFGDDGLCACLVLSGLGEGIIKMRQVAVRESLRGRGLGAKLVSAAEVEGLSLGGVTMMCHAREGVVGFYQRLGYEVRGEPFEEVGIRHLRMEKMMG